MICTCTNFQVFRSKGFGKDPICGPRGHIAQPLLSTEISFNSVIANFGVVLCMCLSNKTFVESIEEKFANPSKKLAYSNNEPTLFAEENCQTINANKIHIIFMFTYQLQNAPICHCIEYI